MKTTKKLTALMAAFIFAFAFAVVNPQRVQAAGYTITFDPAGSGKAVDGDGNTITSAEENDWVYLEPTVVEGKYVTSWTANPTFTWEFNGTYGVFKMPAENVTIKPIYENQTAYNLDLSCGETTIDGDAARGLMNIYYPGKIISFGEVIEFDLDKNGKKDVKITAPSDWRDPTMIEKLASTNLTGTYSVTEPNTSKYSPINFKFGESGNTGGGNNPANESGATTGETPADTAKADPNKAPKTGESNAFVLSMLGIIAVAGMGLYVGKKQEN